MPGLLPERTVCRTQANPLSASSAVPSGADDALKRLLSR